MMDAAEALNAWYSEGERALSGRYIRPEAPCRVAVLIADGVKAEPIAMTVAALAKAGAEPWLLGVARGTVRSTDGQEFVAEAALGSVEPDSFDALVLPDGHEAVTRLLQDRRSVGLVNAQCRLRHPILVGSASVRMLEAAGITASSRAPDRGFTIGAMARLPHEIREFVSAVRGEPA
jgi:DJ-1/PfpI family protein